MTEHPDALVYRRTAAAFRSDDLDAVKAMIAPEVVWHVPGDHPMAGVIDVREALFAWFARLPRLGFWLVERDVFASDDHVCAISTMGARRDGVSVETRVVSVFRYRDRHQVERWIYPTTPPRGTRSSRPEPRRESTPRSPRTPPTDASLACASVQECSLATSSQAVAPGRGRLDRRVL